MKHECLYKIGDVVNVKDCNTPMLITGFVLDDDDCVLEYEIVSVKELHYCTESVIEGLEAENES